MAYTLGNKCAKNLCKRIVLLQLIIENVVTCFFLEHSVVCQINRSGDIAMYRFQHFSLKLPVHTLLPNTDWNISKHIMTKSSCYRFGSRLWHKES